MTHPTAADAREQPAMDDTFGILDLGTLRRAYDSGVTPAQVIAVVEQRIKAAGDRAIFISRASHEQLAAAISDLLARAPRANSLPLWGVPFAIKDNIDAAGFATTAACPEFAYRPDASATVVARLVAAGAILVGKTNLDQFATGLNGTRSPYGAPRCVFDERYISGGSSSGSAVGVAAGLVSFALGTDTAGSGRVPAALNNIVGIKPSPGRVSNTGVVPACRTLDVVTIFAPGVSDGIEIRAVMEGRDPTDPYSREPGEVALPDRLRLGIPAGDELAFFGNEAFRGLFVRAVERARMLGAEIVEIDYRPYREAAALLYNGPWVAERLVATRDILTARPDAVNGVVRDILHNATRLTAVDVFQGEYRLKALLAEADREWARVDALLLPTTPSTYTVADMMDNPIELNSHLGYYTNFANFMRCAAIAVPAGRTAAGLSFGIQIVGPCDSDAAIAPFAAAMHQAAQCGAGTDGAYHPASVPMPLAGERLRIAVVGAHLRGMPLNGELTGRGGLFVRTTTTAPGYRLYELAGTVPAKPGLVRDDNHDGDGVEVEIWSLSPVQFAGFVASIPQPLGIGRISLADGSEVSGFICEPAGLIGATDITVFGGWRQFRQQAEGTGPS
ncbi:allophanate hydrolase [Komagataeibacter rhaeticus]|uniref:allophanate hydrolase n=1 Tax=Komagataeibacter rhaeticus TaxID=215221 RepID=UPI000D8D4FA5|nr:allophanate hydrolase [Komagataeibacter rhaeticus]PYD52291.1 allophanate hydrolase [Komagataeibacter rhaeticus]GBQ13279.1 amidase [Komagataeibacter rhaeticus DSM 16663]